MCVAQGAAKRKDQSWRPQKISCWLPTAPIFTITRLKMLTFCATLPEEAIFQCSEMLKNAEHC